MSDKPILKNLAWAGASCVLLLAVFSNLNKDVFFTSDTLYLPCLYKDFTEQHSLNGWHLNPAPNFFPDMLFYFLLMACCGGSLLVASFVFAVAQYFAVLLVLRWIFKLVMPQAPLWYHHLTCFILSFSLLELLCLTRDHYYSFYLVSNAFHTGAFVMGLLCLALTLRYVSAPHNGTLYLLFALITLGVLSDKLFIVLYPIPVLMTFTCFFKRTGPRIFMRIGLVNAMAVFAGFVVFNNIDLLTGTYIEQPRGTLDFAESKKALMVFLVQMKGYLSTFGFRSLSLYAFIAAFIMACILCAKLTRRKGNLLITLFLFFFVVYSVVVWMAPVLNASYAGNDCIRYNIYPVYLAALCIPVMIAYNAKNLAFLENSLTPRLAGGFSLLLLCFAAFYVTPQGLKDYFNYYPGAAQKIDELAAKEHLVNGVGDYWQAKKVTMFSKKGVRIRAVFDDLAIWKHVANERWFFAPGTNYDFILLSGFQDTSRYHRTVHPLQLIANGNITVVKTALFHYDKELGILPINTGDSE